MSYIRFGLGLRWERLATVRGLRYLIFSKLLSVLRLTKSLAFKYFYLYRGRDSWLGKVFASLSHRSFSSLFYRSLWFVVPQELRLVAPKKYLNRVLQELRLMVLQQSLACCPTGTSDQYRNFWSSWLVSIRRSPISTRLPSNHRLITLHINQRSINCKQPDIATS